MTYHSPILIDSGFLIAYYSGVDRYHESVCRFLEGCQSRLVTSQGCVTEVMWLLSRDWRTQNEFLLDLEKELYDCVSLVPQDFVRLAELNEKYEDLPGDFADLSLVVISERLNIRAIATLDSDFDVYRRYRREPFERVFF